MFTEYFGGHERQMTLHVFGAQGDVEKFALARLKNYYGAVDANGDNAPDPDEYERIYDADGGAMVEITRIDPAPMIDIINLCGQNFFIDLNNLPSAAIPGPYDYCNTNAQTP